MTTEKVELNTICYSCGYTDPLGGANIRGTHRDQDRARDILNLHAHHSGKCPVTGGPIDPPHEVK